MTPEFIANLHKELVLLGRAFVTMGEIPVILDPRKVVIRDRDGARSYYVGDEEISADKIRDLQYITPEKLAQYLGEHGYSRGGEPEYVEIRTPIENDNKGWFVQLVWMHHDGDVYDALFRSPSLDICLNDMWDYLVTRDAQFNS